MSKTKKSKLLDSCIHTISEVNFGCSLQVPTSLKKITYHPDTGKCYDSSGDFLGFGFIGDVEAGDEITLTLQRVKPL